MKLLNKIFNLFRPYYYKTIGTNNQTIKVFKEKTPKLLIQFRYRIDIMEKGCKKPYPTIYASDLSEAITIANRLKNGLIQARVNHPYLFFAN